MSKEHFTGALEQELRLQGCTFRRADLLAFVDDIWPLAADDPEPVRWAREFIDRGGASVPV